MNGIEYVILVGITVILVIGVAADSWNRRNKNK
jgi:hypothetical protein